MTTHSTESVVPVPYGVARIVRAHGGDAADLRYFRGALVLVTAWRAYGTVSIVVCEDIHYTGPTTLTARHGEVLHPAGSRRNLGAEHLTCLPDHLVHVL